MNPAPETTTRWGRSRLGGGQALLLVASAVIGVLLSAGLGTFVAVFADSPRPLRLAIAMGAFLLPMTCALGWVVLVDRSTVTGAVKRPEESVESFWYKKAATGTFNDVIMMAGIGAGLFTWVDLQASVGLVLLLVLALTGADFGVRYLAARRG